MTYAEKSTQVVLESQIACMVLLNHDNTDMEMWPLRPRQAPPSELTSPEEFAARKLRPVGVVGFGGTNATVAFKEPLEAPVVSAIAKAFLEYLRVLLGQSFEEQMKAAEIAELERVLTLPDTRIN